MRVLVVVGSDLSINSSANLCHKAYIQGLLENGCTVEILTVGNDSENNQTAYNDDNILVHLYPMKSLYERVGRVFKRNQRHEEAGIKNMAVYSSSTQASRVLHQTLYKTKRVIHSLYGPYEVYVAWARKAISYRENKRYDLVVSLSFPPVSHYLVYCLLKRRHITTKRWVQIWEDPWCQDLVFRSLNDEKTIRRAQKEEAFLLDMADEVLYVSPITLDHQKKMFPKYSNKMKWLPVPTYYSTVSSQKSSESNSYGYFGDYSTQIRNLDPFYLAAKQNKIAVNICGFSDKMFASYDNIVVRPRISLEELKPIEDRTNILVFLCNLHGGQIPGKIYQYSATNKTILFILDGTLEEQRVLQEYFGQYNRYVFCRNTVDDISRAIQQVESGEMHGISNYPLDCFAPQKIVEKILNGAQE